VRDRQVGRHVMVMEEVAEENMMVMIINMLKEGEV
jgi:hypothetical protein